MAVRLAHMVYGSPNHQLLPVVILHGVLGNKINWRSTALKLSNKTGRQVQKMQMMHVVSMCLLIGIHIGCQKSWR